MDHKPALYALVRLHAELGGKIKDNKRQALKLRADMKHVEAVLKMLEPGFSARSISARRRYNPNPLFPRGHIARAALGVLKDATVPMTAEEIAVALVRSKGVQNPDKVLMQRMYGAVEASLRKNVTNVVVVNEGRPRRWALKTAGTLG
jgi:hypothetical protein